MSFPTAYSEAELRDMLDSNNSCSPLAPDAVERLLTLARQRADSRGEDSALDQKQVECIIATDWSGFAADEFGYDNGSMNEVAMGVFNPRVSAGKGADLFTDVVVVQSGWLTTGDGRRNKIEEYLDEDYNKAELGEMWLANGAQKYIAVLALGPELVHGETTLDEAM